MKTTELKIVALIIWLFILIGIWCMSCTKVRPDWDQVSCYRCTTTVEKWADSLSGYMSSEVVFDGTLCDKNLENFRKAKDSIMIKNCETVYDLMNETWRTQTYYKLVINKVWNP